MAKNLQTFEITGTIYSNSERSEQFLVTECFFNLFLEVSHIYEIRTIRIQIGKNYWDLETHKEKHGFFHSRFTINTFLTCPLSLTGH